MDVCLGLGVGETMLTLMQSRVNASGSFQGPYVEKLRGSKCSWSSVPRKEPLQCSRLLTGEPSASDRSVDTRSVSSVSDSPSDDSRSSSSSSSSECSNASSSSSYWKTSLWGSTKRASRKPALVEKIPFGRSTEYLTVHVGRRTELSVKFQISRKLLAHPLFQVLLKCSQDEFGEDYAVKKGVAIACDPALFVKVVEAVDKELSSAEMLDHATQ